MIDWTLKYMKEANIPITRDNYVELNWMGDYDPKQPLPAELESEIPEELQHPDFKK